MTDAELELHIKHCGEHFLKAHADGDMPLARDWLARQTEAVLSRSPAQAARMEACYFAAQGADARTIAHERSVA